MMLSSSLTNFMPPKQRKTLCNVSATEYDPWWVGEAAAGRYLKCVFVNIEKYTVHKDYVRVCTPTETLSTVHVYVKENATLK